MTIRIAPILGLFSVAGLSIIVTGCEPLENVLRVANSGQPMPGGPSTASVYSVSAVVEVEGALDGGMEPEPCVILATEFRQWMCSEDGRKILIP